MINNTLIGLTINLETINEAFDDMPHAEAVRILRGAVEELAYMSLEDIARAKFIKLRDTHGNVCGEVKFTLSDDFQ